MKMELIQEVKQRVESINIMVSGGLEYLVQDGNIVLGVDSLRIAMTHIHELQDLLEDK